MGSSAASPHESTERVRRRRRRSAAASEPVSSLHREVEASERRARHDAVRAIDATVWRAARDELVVARAELGRRPVAPAVKLYRARTARIGAGIVAMIAVFAVWATSVTAPHITGITLFVGCFAPVLGWGLGAAWGSLRARAVSDSYYAPTNDAQADVRRLRRNPEHAILEIAQGLEPQSFGLLILGATGLVPLLVHAFLGGVGAESLRGFGAWLRENLWVMVIAFVVLSGGGLHFAWAQRHVLRPELMRAAGMHSLRGTVYVGAATLAMVLPALGLFGRGLSQATIDALHAGAVSTMCVAVVCPGLYVWAAFRAREERNDISRVRLDTRHRDGLPKPEILRAALAQSDPDSDDRPASATTGT